VRRTDEQQLDLAVVDAEVQVIVEAHERSDLEPAPLDAGEEVRR
jgi:hypothetical protein